MKLRYKILNGVLGMLVLALVLLGVVLSYDADCGPAPEAQADVETMQAIVARCYGSPEVLELTDVAKPVPGDDDVLVRVMAAGVNPLDWHYMRGSPYFMRLGTGIGAPDDVRTGVDFAGVVEAVGKDVTKFRPGDEVFGGAGGAFAEYVVVGEDRAIVRKPGNISFAEAAAVPIAAITALQALRDHGRVGAGDRVLVNGASGGVGTYAVQIAGTLGAEVSGVCSTRNVELVRSLGAHRVFDYTKENYTEGDAEFDVIIDNVGNHSLVANTRVMSSDGRFVIVGAQQGDWIRPLLRPLAAMVVAPFVDQEIGMFIAALRQDDLAYLAGLLESGEIRSVIDRRYTIADAAEAMRYSESGRARGKIVITVGAAD
ncbi:MAG: NAD(P)-dependent alcohol dehydrogenase [Woeseiaceae bacterium]|nr:NAD(P)-dependent alcohol dehydrogenase [Woeseiaceae bacterium]